jgi:hypothetical protein
MIAFIVSNFQLGRFYLFLKAHCQIALVNKLLPWFPLCLFQMMAFRLTSRHSLAFSSIPGPEQQVFLAGKPVSACRFAVLGHLQPIFTILTYDGVITITLVVDTEEIPGVHLLPSLFTKSLTALADEFGVEIG